MKTTVEAIFAGLLFLTVAAIWIRRVTQKGELGAVLATAPDGTPKWPVYLFYILAALRGFEAIYELANGNTTQSIIEGCFALAWGGMGFLHGRARRGLRVCQGGIDLGLLVFPWHEIQSWNWTQDRTGIEFWTNSPWRFMHHPLPGRPLRFKTEFSSEVDSALTAVAPRGTGGQVA